MAQLTKQFRKAERADNATRHDIAKEQRTTMAGCIALLA